MKKTLIFTLFFLSCWSSVVVNADEKNGIIEDNGKIYYYLNGEKQKGFQRIDDKIYFFSRSNDNAMRTGMFMIDGYTYYFDESGVMQTGMHQLGEDHYYFDEQGRKSSGFKTIDGNTYFFSRSNDNAMRTGMFMIDGYTYYFDEFGKMQTGWYEENNQKYYFNSDGKKARGFTTIEGNTYFFSRVLDNFMRTGWILIDGHMYYFDQTTGIMCIGENTIEGVNYIFSKNGKLQDGFTTDIAGNVRYYFPDGTYANDWITITGKKYFFNSLGIMVGENVKKVIDVSSYQGDIDWERVVKEGQIDGVILRIAAGCEKEDIKLAYNVKELKRLGVPYGIYIYSYAENYFEGKLYAQFTVDVIKKYELNPTLGIYLDLESNNVTSYMGITEYENVTRAYLETMKIHGYENITKIYTYKNYAETALNSEYLRNLITWIAQYNHFCTYDGYYNAWQYSSSEKIAGIKGNVDVSVWY